MFKQATDNLKNEGRYRVFADLERRVGEAPFAYHRTKDGIKKVTVWCSNDYLGMCHHPAVLASMKHALETHGAGAGGTRNISGNHHTIIELEAELADLHRKEAGLCFSSGYVANQAALCTLGSNLKDAIIFSDADNHASMIEGIRHSRAERHVFLHSDPEHLESLLKQADPNRPKIVAFESVYSMGGDIAPIDDLISVCKRHNALTYIDETHAVGLYGPHGGGIVEALGLLDEVDCLQGGLGKGFGVVGGFITGSKELIDFVRSFGAGFIFTTTMPPVVAAGGLASIRHLKSSASERRTMQRNVDFTRSILDSFNIPMISAESHIIPVMIGDSKICKQVSDTLLSTYDIYIQPINYPTVPKGTERLRITPNPSHTIEMAQELGKALNEIFADLKLKRSTDAVQGTQRSMVQEANCSSREPAPL